MTIDLRNEARLQKLETENRRLTSELNGLRQSVQELARLVSFPHAVDEGRLALAQTLEECPVNSGPTDQAHQVAVILRGLRASTLAESWKIRKATGQPIIRLTQMGVAQSSVVQAHHDERFDIWRVSCVRGPGASQLQLRHQLEAQVREEVVSIVTHHHLGTVEQPQELAA